MWALERIGDGVRVQRKKNGCGGKSFDCEGERVMEERAKGGDKQSVAKEKGLNARGKGGRNKVGAEVMRTHGNARSKVVVRKW